MMMSLPRRLLLEIRRRLDTRGRRFLSVRSFRLFRQREDIRWLTVRLNFYLSDFPVLRRLPFSPTICRF